MSIRSRVARLLAGPLILLACAEMACGQPVPSRQGSSTHIFPAGGQRGTTVRVRVGTECMPPRTGLRVWGEGVAAPAVLGDEAQPRVEPSPVRKPTEIPIHYPREWHSEFTIASEAPTGPVYWRLANAGTGTGARPFLIGELPEWIETESNSVPEGAEDVVLPVTINGRIAGERDADYYRFSLERGQRITCEVVAARLGSPLDPVLEILDPQGDRVETVQTRAGSDPVLAFICSTPGPHLLRVSHVGFHGGPHYVYRITLSERPFTAFAFPPGGQAGKEVDVTFFQLAAGNDERAAGGFRQLVQRVKFPDASDASAALLFQSPDPAAASLQLASGTLREFVAKEPHTTPEAAQPLTLPVTVNGRFIQASDVDWYRISARKDEILEFRFEPVAGSSALPILEIRPAETPASAPLVRISAVEALPRPARLEWKAPADGAWLLRVVDLQHGLRGDPAFIYRLTIRPAVADFGLSLPLDYLNVVQGGQAELDLAITRQGGFNGPIDLQVEGPPAAVKLLQSQIPADKSQFKLTFAADAGALPEAFSLRIMGRAAIGEREVTHAVAAPHLGLDAEGLAIGAATLEHVWLAVLHKPLFKLQCSEAYEYAYRGTIYPYFMDVELLDGFAGEITLQRGDRQNRDLDGIQMLELRVPAGETRPVMPLYLPETMHINVQSQSQLYTQAYALFQDASGRPQSVMVVSEKRNMLRTLPTVVKLNALEPVIRGAAGAEVVCHLQLQRTPNFTGPLLLELQTGSGCTAEQVVIPAEATAGAIRVRLPELRPNETPPSAAARELMFRATGKMPNGMTVVTEAKAALEFMSPP